MKEDILIAADTIGKFCRLYMNIRKDLPIRSSEMGVLIFIQKQEEAVTPLMISNFFQITKPSVTSLLNTLIKKEYLVKKPSLTDRRSYTVSITRKGKNLVALTEDEYFKTMSILEENMESEEFEELVQLLQKANHLLSRERLS